MIQSGSFHSNGQDVPGVAVRRNGRVRLAAVCNVQIRLECLVGVSRGAVRDSLAEGSDGVMRDHGALLDRGALNGSRGEGQESQEVGFGDHDEGWRGRE